MSGPSELAKAKLKVMALVPYIQKERKPGLNYTFAGEAAILEKLHPAFREAGLVWAVTGCEVVGGEQYTTKNGASMNRVMVRATYSLTHAESGQAETIQAIGEGSDSGDKATSKAMTSALKYALRQTFLIETGDDPDHTPSEQQERGQQRHAQPQQQQAAPRQQAQQQPAKPKQQPARTPLELWERMGAKVPATGEELYAWLESVEKTLKEMPGGPGWRVFDGVISILQVATDQDIKAVAHRQHIEAAWNNAKNYVKTQADLTPAAR